MIAIAIYTAEELRDKRIEQNGNNLEKDINVQML